MTAFDPGGIYAYNYLWRHQRVSGEESGRKALPVALVFRSLAEPVRLYLFPITTRKPEYSRLAVEIPPQERLAAGLDKQCWLVIDELNVTLAKRQYDFVSLRPLGHFSPSFHRTLAAQCALAIRAGAAKPIRRS